MRDRPQVGTRHTKPPARDGRGALEKWRRHVRARMLGASRVTMNGDITNEMFSLDALFCTACALAGIESTTRQASKWRNGRGRARLFEKEAKEVLCPAPTE